MLRAELGVEGPCLAGDPDGDSQVIQPGMPHYLTFDFGVWRNRVRDGAGIDVTKFGMWSNYTVLLVTLAAVLVFCCGGGALISAVSGGS